MKTLQTNVKNPTLTRWSRRTVFAVLTAALISTSAPSMAQAAVINGNYATWYVNGIAYSGRAGGIVDGSGQRAYQETRRGSGTAPIGYLYADAALYSGNVLCSRSGAIYNSQPVQSLYAYTAAPGCYNGTSYADGSSAAFDGNRGTYTGTDTPRTPNFSGPAARTSSSVDAQSITSDPAGETVFVPSGVNASGLSYGSMADTTPETEPDLIATYATNGALGYTYKTALNEGVGLTPEQAIDWQKKKAGKPTIIPVFETDGITKVGVFKFYPGVPTTPSTQPSK